MKKYINILGYLISIFFLYFIFKDTNFSLIIKHFNYINPFYITIAFLLSFCFLILRGLYQLNSLYYFQRKLHFSISLVSIAIAQFFNNIFPARLGEIIRTFFLSKQAHIKKASVLSYIFIEKLIDLIFILLLLLIIIFLGFNNVDLSKLLFSSFLFIFLIICSLFIFFKGNKFILSLIKRVVPNKFHKLIKRLNSEILEGFMFYKNIPQIFRGILLLLGSWLIVLLTIWFISYPYVQLLGLPYYSCLFFMVFSVLSLSVPSAPAGLGVMHYGLFLAVKLLSNNIEPQINLVAAFVIVLHFFFMLLDLTASGSVILIYKLTQQGHLELPKN